MRAIQIQTEVDETMTAFQQYLKSYFKRPGALTQKEIAEKAGIHWVTLNRLVNGKHVPSLEDAEAIVAATGSTLGRILKKSEKRHLVSA